MRAPWILALLFFGAAAFFVWQKDSKPEAGAAMHDAANKLIGTLTAEQKTLALLPYDSTDRVTWIFVPRATRKGVPLRDMTESQRDVAMELLKTVVSQIGYQKCRGIMALENVLLALEKNPNPTLERNPVKYYFTIYGTPAAESTWGLSFEGHHQSLNFVIEKGKIVDSTPQFFGSNPAELKAAVGDLPQGHRILKDEEVIAYKLLGTLTEEQRKVAIFSDKAPSDIRVANVAQPAVGPVQGIAASSLSAEQKGTLRALIRVYSDAMLEEVQKQRWDLIEQAGFDKIHFTWAGGQKPGEGHFYCVQGPTFVIELNNTQNDASGNPANHVHCVWRDLTGDFNLPVK